MSQEQAIVFIEKMKNDEAFRDEVIKIKDAESKIEYITREGLNFTSDELKFAAYSALIKD